MMENQLYIGNRGDEFKTLIDGILKMGEVSKKYRKELLSDESLALYSTSFTHPSVDSDNNYEFYETLGDISLKKSIVWYFSKRFPQINTPEGVDIMSRMKMKFEQSKSFAPLAESLNFWPYVSTNINRDSSYLRQKILEDVFEAFFAVTEILLDKYNTMGVGYVISYRIIAKLLDQIEIHIDWEYLVDAKTRVKEIFDYYKSRGIGKIEYIKLEPEILGDDDRIFKVSAKQTRGDGSTRIIGQGKGHDPSSAEQDAATKAFELLKSEGITKAPPKEYIKFCT